LWERFAREFPEVARTGQPSTRQVRQVGGSVDRETIAIPEMRLRVAGSTAYCGPRTYSRDRSAMISSMGSWVWMY